MPRLAQLSYSATRARSNSIIIKYLHAELKRKGYPLVQPSLNVKVRDVLDLLDRPPARPLRIKGGLFFSPYANYSASLRRDQRGVPEGRLFANGPFAVSYVIIVPT